MIESLSLFWRLGGSTLPFGLGLALVGGTLVACDANPATQPLGSMDVTVTTPAPTYTTADGWSIKLDRFLVHLTAVTVAGSDGVVAASATPQIVDQAAPGTKSLLTATVRTARLWDAVSFEIGPAATGTVTEVPPVTPADFEQMATAGYSIYIEGKATKAELTKTMKWGFTSDTVFKDCAGEQSGALLRGLLVPQNGNDTADVVLDASVFFRDDVNPTKGALRFDAIASADADADGTITLEELHGVTLDAAAAVGGGFAPGPANPATDLGGYVEAQARQIVAAFRAKGSCTAEPVEAAAAAAPAAPPSP